MAIYALRDPRTGAVRYVGKTSQRPEVRLRGHLFRARRGGRSHCSRWLRGLLLADLAPSIEVLQYVRDERWQDAERYWIRYFRMVGDLCNLTEGGEGVSGRVVPAEERAERSAAWSVEARQAAGERLRALRPQIETARLVGLRTVDSSTGVRKAWAEGKYASRRPRLERRRAADFLRRSLRDGPRRVAEIKAEAALVGIGRAALQREGKLLGVRLEYDGTGPRSWRLTGVV